MPYNLCRALILTCSAALGSISLSPNGFSLDSPESTYLTNLQVSLTSFTGKGSAESAGQVKHSSGFDLAVEKPWQLSKRWVVGPILKGGSHTARLVDERFSGTRVGTALEMRTASLGANVGYILPLSSGRLPVVFLKGSAGIVRAKALVDRTEKDRFAQSSFGHLQGQVRTLTHGILLPVSDAFHVEFAAALIQYAIATGGTSSTDVEEIHDGTTFRFTQDETPAAAGLPDTLQLKTQALSVGIGTTF